MMLRVSFLVSFFVACCPAMGQALQKKSLTQGDYKLWHTLDMGELSPDGKWISYNYRYADQQDTLAISAVGSSFRYNIANGTNGKFGNGFFACLLPGSKAALYDLKHRKLSVFSNTDSFRIVMDGTYIILPENSEPGSLMKLYIRDRIGSTLNTIADVTSYEVLQGQKSMLYTSRKDGRDRICSYDFASRKATEIYSSIHPIHSLAGNAEGTYYAFWEETPQNDVIRLLRLSDNKGQSLILDKKIGVAAAIKLEIGYGGGKVFFSCKDTLESSQPLHTEMPEVWSSSDSIIFPFKNTIGKDGKQAVWLIAENRYEVLTSNWLSEFSLSGTQKYAILRPYAYYGQDGRLFDQTDVYVKSLDSGKITVILQDYTADPNMLTLSPVGDKMAYYSKGSWWSYDMDTGRHTMLAEGIPVQWDNRQDTAAVQLEVYGNPAWSDDGKFLLLYDRYDLWKVACDGSQALRMTRGKEKRIVFRIEYASLHFSDGHFQYAPSQAALIDGSGPVLLSARGSDNRNGLFLLENNTPEKALCYGFFTIDQVRLAGNGTLAYRQQSFEKSPEIIYRDTGKGKGTVQALSNRQQQTYLWGKAECIYYKGSKGEDLKAALLYPAGYEAGKKYPMVVNIYQSLSQGINRYVNPSEENESGFNATNYTLDGYSVLLPDISYELGNPGPSLTYCVEAAVHKAIDMGVADSGKIGLIGHSFGGYETNYILTASAMFAAGVSGAGISDSTGIYFSTSPTLSSTEAWRFEQQQFRMGHSFYEDKKGYFNNSPIFRADSINTPLLLWAGKEDITVSCGQSMAMYNALRRLEKECIMLLYAGEGHNLVTKKNKVDLTRRITQWFGHHLKGDPSEDWMKK